MTAVKVQLILLQLFLKRNIFLMRFCTRGFHHSNLNEIDRADFKKLRLLGPKDFTDNSRTGILSEGMASNKFR